MHGQIPFTSSVSLHGLPKSELTGSRANPRCSAAGWPELDRNSPPLFDLRAALEGLELYADTSQHDPVVPKSAHGISERVAS